MQKKKLEINGNNFQTIEGFYAELNRLAMADEDWKLGASLDAFHDFLYGTYGSINGFEQLEIIWLNSEKSKNDLGFETTLQYYQNKLGQPQKFNSGVFQKKIEDLHAGIGKTYFEILLEIMSEHADIHLVLK